MIESYKTNIEIFDAHRDEITGRIKNFAEENQLEVSEYDEDKFVLEGEKPLNHTHEIYLEDIKEGNGYSLGYVVKLRKLSLIILSIGSLLLFYSFVPLFINEEYIPGFVIYFSSGVLLMFVLLSLKGGFLEKFSSLDTYLVNIEMTPLIKAVLVIGFLGYFIFIYRLVSGFIPPQGRLLFLIAFMGLTSGFIFEFFRLMVIPGVETGDILGVDTISLGFFIHTIMVVPFMTHLLLMEGWIKSLSSTNYFVLASYGMLILYLLFLSLILGLSEFLSSIPIVSGVFALEERGFAIKKANYSALNPLRYLVIPLWAFSSIAVYLEWIYLLKILLYKQGSLVQLSLIPKVYSKVYWQVFEEIFNYPYIIGSLILLVFFSMPIYFAISNFLSWFGGEDEYEHRCGSESSVQKLLEIISDDAGIEAPTLKIIKEKNMIATCDSKGLLKTTHTIELSERVLTELNQEELKAVLYHEIYHLKNHTKLKNMLKMISRITFFGKGTLTSMMGLSREEYRADEFAARNTSYDAVISFLEKFKSNQPIKNSSGRMYGEEAFKYPESDDQLPQKYGVDRLINFLDGLQRRDQEFRRRVFKEGLPDYVYSNLSDRIVNMKRLSGEH